MLEIFQLIHAFHCFAYSRNCYGSLTSCLVYLYKYLMDSYYSFFRIMNILADSTSYPVASLSVISLVHTLRSTGLLLFRSIPKGCNNNKNQNHHYHKRLGACFIPNVNVYIESRMICCALFNRLNNSMASYDVMTITSGSCLLGWSRRVKNLYRTFTFRLVTPGSKSKTHSESINWLPSLFAYETFVR